MRSALGQWGKKIAQNTRRGPSNSAKSQWAERSGIPKSLGLLLKQRRDYSTPRESEKKDLGGNNLQLLFSKMKRYSPRRQKRKGHFRQKKHCEPHTGVGSCKAQEDRGSGWEAGGLRESTGEQRRKLGSCSDPHPRRQVCEGRVYVRASGNPWNSFKPMLKWSKVTI